MYRRGFKAQCQRDAEVQRALLNLTQADRLDPRQLAEHHDIALRTPEDLQSLSPADLAELTDEASGNPDTWSAISLLTGQGRLTIYNPTHTPERINNSLSHELAHFLLGHPHGQMTPIDGHLFRQYNEVHEKEADWLAGVLLLPDSAIKHAAQRGWGRDRTADHHRVSLELVNWRWRSSGVDRYIPART